MPFQHELIKDEGWPLILIMVSCLIAQGKTFKLSGNRQIPEML